MFLSGQFAIRMLPRWSVPSDMQSNIDPNLRLDSGSDALASVGLAPLRPEIQTPPAWQRTFLTPQANLDLLNEVPVVVVVPATSQPTWTATQAAAPTEVQNPTATATLLLTPTPFPTNTMVFVLPTWTFTPKPPQPTFTNTPTITLTPSLTFTSTTIPTDTPVPPPTLTPITPDTWPPQVGTAPDGVIYKMSGNQILILELEMIVDGNPGPDLVFYEWANGPGIYMDTIVLYVSQDGHEWFMVFNWGDNIADTNSNLNIAGPLGGSEYDDRPINASFLYPNGVFGDTGITIDLDMVVPPGTYNYLKIYCPPSSDNQCDLDAVHALP
jgi:hypothetical protein